MKATKQVGVFSGKSKLIMSNVWGSVARKLSEYRKRKTLLHISIGHKAQ